jgi:hypothetical protein
LNGKEKHVLLVTCMWEMSQVVQEYGRISSGWESGVETLFYLFVVKAPSRLGCFGCWSQSRFAPGASFEMSKVLTRTRLGWVWECGGEAPNRCGLLESSSRLVALGRTVWF